MGAAGDAPRLARAGAHAVARRRGQCGGRGAAAAASLGPAPPGVGRRARGLRAMGRVIKASDVTARAAAPAGDAVRVDAAALFEAARREGFATGHADGTAQAAVQAAVVLAEARAEAVRALAAVTPTAIALAAKMAEKIVRTGRRAGRGRAGRDRRRSAGHLPDRRRVTSCPRAPRTAVRARAASGSTGRPRARGSHRPRRRRRGHPSWLRDRYAARGRVDARLETQLAALERALAAVEGARG